MWNTPAYFADFDQDDASVQQETDEACIASISPLERQKRLRFGLQLWATFRPGIKPEDLSHRAVRASSVNRKNRSTIVLS